MFFLTIVPKDIWYIISKFLTFEQILLISLYDKTPYPEDSYVFREYYEQEIGGAIKENYKIETIKVLDEVKDLSPQILLEYSAKYNYLELVKKSIGMGADIIPGDITMKDNRQILYRSVSNGYIDIVKYLIGYFGKSCVEEGNYNVFMFAASRGKLEILKYLTNYLDRESVIEAIKCDGYDCLRRAALNGCLETLKYLIELIELIGNIDEAIGKCNWYLKWVIIHKHHEVVKYLLSKGADISVLSEEQQRFYSS